MDILVDILKTLNTLSPLAVIALLGVIIFVLVRGKTSTDAKVEKITSNHLHNLPDMSDDLNRILEANVKSADTLQRIEVKMREEFSFIRTKLTNGNIK